MYYICHCCGTGYHSTEKQDPNRDKGFGTCILCTIDLAKDKASEYAELEAKVAKSLNPGNRKKFLAMEPDLRTGVIGQMIEDGIITYSIGSNN